MRKSPPHSISILLAIILVFTPVCTYASVDDNVSNSKLELLVGAPLDTDEPKTVFDWFRSIWSELLTITTTMDTVVGDVNSLEEKVVALSSKIDSQTTTLNQKIDSQAGALSSKIDAQTTTLSNKISSSGGSTSPSTRALPTGVVGTTFSLGGYTYVICAKGSNYVRCATNLGKVDCQHWASAAANQSTDQKNTLASYYVVNNVSGPPTSESDYSVEVITAFGGRIYSNVSMDSHPFFYISNGSVSKSWHSWHDEFACTQWYTIYRK